MADSLATAQHNKLLSKLNASLDDLEDVLEPLLAKTLPETMESFDQIQQAKMQVLIPYVAYDLIFVYLKTRGIDPKQHAVFTELERIKQYFAKIKRAESPEKQRLAIDKEAAGRFIQRAIARVKASEPVEVENGDYLGEDDQDETEERDEAGTSTPLDDIPTSRTKRTRPAFDPFAGYGDTENGPSLAETHSNAIKRAKTGLEPEARNFKYVEVEVPLRNKRKSETKDVKGKGKEVPRENEIQDESEDIAMPDGHIDATKSDDEDGETLEVVGGGDLANNAPSQDENDGGSDWKKVTRKAKVKEMKDQKTRQRKSTTYDSQIRKSKKAKKGGKVN